MLISQILVSRDEHVEESVDQPEELSILNARPSLMLHGHNFVIPKLNPEGVREGLVKNDPLHEPDVRTLLRHAD